LFIYFLSSIFFALKGKIKKVEFLPPFLPQIYHKLNLLMLWSYKGMKVIILKEIFRTKYRYIRLKACIEGFWILQHYYNKKGGISSAFFAPNLP